MSKLSYTLNEILGQPAALKAILKEVELKRSKLLELFERKPSDVIFVGCGSSYYLALSASSVFRELVKVNAIGLPSSEVFLYPTTLSESTLLVSISRSGETTETILATKFAKQEKKAKVLAVTCYEESELAKISDVKIISHKGKEKSIVMTKSFTSMLMGAQAVSAVLSKKEQFYKGLSTLPEICETIIKENNSLAKEIGEDSSLKKFVFLGSGPLYGVACESMLKMKEMALAWSEAYHSLEFRHGPKSIVDPETLVVFLLSDSARSYEVNLVEEVRSLGAKVLAICEKPVDSEYTVEIRSDFNDFLRAPLYMPITQLLAYYKAVSRGLNPDVPKKLSQVVRL